MIISTAYFPSISWIDALKRGAQIEAHENYQKQTNRNRCQIMTAGGSMNLVVPIAHNAGAKIAIREAKIDYAMPWQRQHGRAVMAAYRSAPFWEHFEQRIMPLFELREKFLWDMNLKIVQRLVEVLKIDKGLILTDLFVGAQEPSPRNETQYYQVFAERYAFQADLSVLDLIFCEGGLL